MSVIYIVLPLAVVLAALGVWGFIWAARQGQFDDLETPASRMLIDDDRPSRSRERPKTIANATGDHAPRDAAGFSCRSAAAQARAPRNS